MKELSIEQKAKAYDEALEKARCYYEGANGNEDMITMVTTMFPELAESEDEKIRKEIIVFLTYYHIGQGNSVKYDDGWIAWLEKHGEQRPQGKTALEAINEEKVDNSNKVEPKDYNSIDPLFGKPVDKIEPKFHEGDWIIHRGTENIYQVVAVIDNEYQLKYGDNYTIQYCEDVDRCARLWTIQDAKDGDVLAASSFSSDCIFIFDRLDKWKFNEHNGERTVATGYCCLTLSADNMEFGIQGPDCIEVDTVKPATNIQRNLLEKAMADAGYTFDFKKKELKKIEQKPWSEEDESMLFNVIHRIEQLDHYWNKPTDDKMINWLKSLKDRYAWKPSDEKMEYLAKAITTLGDEGDCKTALILNDLRFELKKLKEE